MTIAALSATLRIVTSNAISDRIRSFIASEFGLPAGRQLADDDSLLNGGLVDSMGVLTLLEFIESEFGVTVADSDLVADNFESIAAMRAFVDGKRAGAGAA